ncbi:hypothetical protein OIU76_025408 [Salix suchowensis]|nr:hypothetical protein OIU76_025408 [Salix suchowensis]
MSISTESGYGLRETLFYRLFGELQVYDTEKHMNEAGACIRHGAVSLDGGMIRVIENGIMSLGCWDSEICFPVGTLENEMNLAPERMKIKMQLEAGMEMLQSIKGKIQHATRLREKAIKKLKKMSKNYNELMDQVEAVESRK